jgi:hypothetical protein
LLVEVRWSLWLAWRGDLLREEDALENNSTCLELADQHDKVTDEATRASTYCHGEQAKTGRFTFTVNPLQALDNDGMRQSHFCQRLYRLPYLVLLIATMTFHSARLQNLA